MKFFIDRPVATAMVYLALLALGVYSYLNTPLELVPEESYPRVYVSARWPGAPPEVIQTQVTAPLEEAAANVKGVRKISSTSQINSSLITLEFNPKTDMEFSTLALREEIAKIRENLPYGVRPEVRPYVPEDFSVKPLLNYTISGNYSLQKLREIVKDKLEFGIGAIKGVASARVIGGSDPELRIIMDEKKLKAYDIHPYEISYALSQRLQTYPAGRVKDGNQEFIFKVSDAVNKTKELSETLISYSGNNPLKLKDLAQIVSSYADIYEIMRINGQPTVTLRILKEPATNTLKVVRDVKAKLEQVKKELPSDLIFRIVNDESKELRKNLNNLYLLAAIITVVVFIMIFIVLRSLKPSLLILSSILFSVVITFNLIFLFKISMNILTLGALALGFGMFVDNAIVVFENILRLREKGLSPFQAALQAPKEVFVAVLASTLTTISVFFAFAYFQGRLRMYYLPLAIVISSALSASLLVSFSLIPALSPLLIKRPRKAKEEKLRGYFEKFLRFILRHPLEVICIVLAVLYGTYRWFKSEVTIGEFFHWYSEQSLSVRVGMPPGTEIETTDGVIKKFEAKVLEADYEKEMNTSVSAENAQIIITFPPKIEYSYRPYLLKEQLIQLATQFAGINIYIYGFDPQGYYSSGLGSATYYESNIKFYGYNLKKLGEITSELVQTLKRNPRIKDWKITSSRYGWWGEDSFEYILKIDNEAMRKYNIDPRYLYSHFSSLVNGTFGIPLKAKIEGKEMNISIKFPKTESMDINTLLDSLIRTPGGEYLRLKEITTLQEKLIASSIDRENQQFQQNVMWEFRGPTKAADNYKKAIFSSLRLPPGFSATLGEEWRWMTEQEKGQIKFAIIFSLIIIFMILAALYESLIQPFFIMLAVPLALIGVFLAFIIAGYPFDSSAYVGVILLGGIVVNNSILVVDNINHKRKQGIPLLEAVLKGTRERVRPILMTTSTTVFGILPMLLIKLEVGKRQIWSSLALCTAGGLVSSTIFILIIIPIFYFYGDRIRFWAQEKIIEFLKALKE
jgi:HAE1 family hydrophobic/amphiphilic exporter-1